MLGRRCAVINLPRYGKLNHYLEAGSKLRRCMHRAISLSLSLSLLSLYSSSALRLFPLFSPFHTLHLDTTSVPFLSFFPSFCINAIISECSTFPSFVLRFLPHVSLFFSILRINTVLFIRVSFFSFFFALLQPLLRTITLRVFLFFFTLPSELLQPTLSNARCLPMFTFLLLPPFFSIIASNVSFLLASFSFLNYRYNDPTNVLSPFLPSSSLSLAQIPDEKY